MSDGWIAAFGRLVAAMLTGGSIPSEGPYLAAPIVWPAIEGFGEGTADQISGLACGPERDGRRGCVVVVDEGRRIRFATLQGRRFTLGREMAVIDDTTTDPRSGATIEVGEADLEAVARDGDVYWLFGSHSTRRKKATAGDCALQPGRRHLYRFAVDGARDLPTFAFDERRAAPEIRRIDRLPDVLARLPELAGVALTPSCAGRGGLDIEGGAVAEGRMMLGLRSPLSVDGEAALAVELDATALAEGGDPRPRLHRLPLGRGIGIRDLAAVTGGHLVLSGASASDDGGEKRPARLWFWPTGGAPIVLGALGGLPKKAKPEGLLVLADTPAAWRVLVVSDGVVGGAPLEYAVARP